MPAKKVELEAYKIAREKLLKRVGRTRLLIGGDHNAALGEKGGGARMGELRKEGAVGKAKLLETGKTDLLEKFISKKGRPFNAYLVWDEKKKQTGFEFEPRKPKKNPK